MLIMLLNPGHRALAALASCTLALSASAATLALQTRWQRRVPRAAASQHAQRNASPSGLTCTVGHPTKAERKCERIEQELGGGTSRGSCVGVRTSSSPPRCVPWRSVFLAARRTIPCHSRGLHRSARSATAQHESRGGREERPAPHLPRPRLPRVLPTPCAPTKTTARTSTQGSCKQPQARRRYVVSAQRPATSAPPPPPPPWMPQRDVGHGMPRAPVWPCAPDCCATPSAAGAVGTWPRHRCGRGRERPAEGAASMRAAAAAAADAPACCSGLLPSLLLSLLYRSARAVSAASTAREGSAKDAAVPTPHGVRSRARQRSPRHPRHNGPRRRRRQLPQQRLHGGGEGGGEPRACAW